jgi:LuxR family maltose regulon positive regulatory protein
LLAAWAQARATTDNVCWVSTEVDDPATSWQRVLTACGDWQDAGTGIGDDSTPWPDRLTVVWDNFDAVTDPQLLAQVERLVATVGHRIRIILGCRRDPPLSLHRWRVTGELRELRADQLAFTVSETADLLVTHGVGLSEPGIAELHALTEGWPAGLRLAALAMRGRPEPERVLADLGVHDAVADYLAREVLAGMAANVRQDLCDTSIMEQLDPSLFQALTGQSYGARLLADLDRSGGFVHRTEGTGGWYRVHPLLGRLLYAELRRMDPDRAPEIHRRAAGWLVAHGLPAEALRHLLAAGDWDAAVELLDRQWPNIVVGPRHRSLRDAVLSPPDAIQAWPKLALAFATERLDAGDPIGLRRYLHLASAMSTGEATGDLTGETSGGGPALDRRPTSPLVIGLQVAEARLAWDLPRVLDLAAYLLQPAAGNGAADRSEQAYALGLIATGAAKLNLGELDEAAPALLDGFHLARRADMGHAQLTAGGHLAMLHATRGRLRAAVRTGQEMLDLADRLGLSHVTDLGWARLGLAEAYYQWNRLDEAQLLLEQAQDHAYADAAMLVTGLIMQARVLVAQGHLAEGYDRIQTARHEATAGRVVHPVRRVLSLVEAELRLAGGDPTGARQRLAGWEEDEPFGAWAAIVEASVLLAEGRPPAAAALVEPYLAGNGRNASRTWAVQAGILTALAGHATGDRARVVRGLDVALEGAEDEGFRRPFAAGGHTLRELITTVAPGMAVYRLVVGDLAAISDPAAPVNGGVLPPRNGRTRPAGSFVEPLTERELTVLRYLQGTLSNVEIASLLYVSVNTVKTHVKNIYRKLNADHRRDAVRRARELRLL